MPTVAILVRQQRRSCRYRGEAAGRRGTARTLSGCVGVWGVLQAEVAEAWAEVKGNVAFNEIMGRAASYFRSYGLAGEFPAGL